MMVMNIVMSDVRQVESGIWKTSLQSHEVNLFGRSSNRYGNLSIIILGDSNATFDEKVNILSFNPKYATLINHGGGKEAIIIHSEDKTIMSVPGATIIPEGDNQFINELTAELKDLGQRLLSEIRTHYNGSLVKANSNRYIESPDNFWTVKVQPRDKSLSITVRGEPDVFDDVSKIEIKRDRHGYSRFKISTENQLNEVVSVILQSLEKKGK